MTARAQAQCTPTCALYRSPFSLEGQAKGATEPFCQPFPGGIPDIIWENRFDHRNVYPGQVGEAVWTPAGPGVEFPSYALNVTEDAASTTLTAAADVIEGAMIALVPSAADIERLTIPGGEPADQLHLTLVYLGDAIDILPSTREELIAWARDMALGWESVQGDGFAPAWFNPTGEEPCLTLVCSGPDLAEMHETALADATDIIDLPDQHMPFIPHVTLIYLNGDQPGDASGPVNREELFSYVRGAVGPITFDRIRLAFGGEVTDIPLGSAGEPEPAGRLASPADVAVDEVGAEPVAASAAPIREIWDGPLH